MKGTLVVDTPQDYEAWLKERAELAGGGAQGASPPSAPKTENATAQPQPSPGAPQQSQPQNKLPQPGGKPEQQPAHPAQSPGQL
jgi:heme/copper-type cytochrome/quinol oxidase subunit 2